MEILKKNNIIVLMIICFGLLCFSCDQLILGPVPENTPEENFNILWNDFDNYYALFDVKKVNWKRLYNIYRPQISSQTTEEELWEIITEMLSTLNDPHVTLYNSDFSKRYQSGILNGLDKHDFDSFVIYRNYLGNNKKITGGGKIIYGELVGHNIGYIRITDFDYGSNNWFYDINKSVNDLSKVNSFIIDLRFNGGGQIDIYRYIASTFINKNIPYLYLRSRNGPKHNDFEPAHLLSVEPRPGHPQFNKTIALLTNRFTSSASEHFIWLFKNYVPYTIQIGDTTTGIFCPRFPMRQLPNGWYYTFSAALITSLNGVALDSLGGLVPNILVMNKVEYSSVGVDSVIERSIQYLENN